MIEDSFNHLYWKEHTLIFLAGIITILVIAGSAYSQTPAENSPIFSPNGRFEKVFGEGAFTEGPVAAQDGAIYFSDIPSSIQGGNIWKYDPKSGKTTIFRSPSEKSNGIEFDVEGRMVVVEGANFGGRGVVRTDMTTGKSEVFTRLYNGRHYNSPNDLTIDEKDRIYFTDPRYVGPEPIEQPVQGVYRIDPDGSVSLIITDAGKPNGIVVSPDQKTLYVGSNDNGSLGLSPLPKGMQSLKGRTAILAYDLNPDGTVKFRKIVVNYVDGGPDGMTVDREGNIYAAVNGTPKPRIDVFSPDGKELASVPTPESPTNVAFGNGAENKILYVTAGKSLYKIGLLKEGYHLPAR